MPYFSYHSGHSGQYCRHAKGRLRDVVERAVAMGFSHYGLSEHCPRYRAEDLFPDEADLSPEDTRCMFREYTEEATALRDEFADRIELLVGFETERLPPDSWVLRMQEVRASGPFEYAVGSVHDVDGTCIDYSPEQTAQVAKECGSVEAMELRYFDQIADLVTQLKPEIVGHLDLIRKFQGDGAGFSDRVMKKIEATLEVVRDEGSLLDVNCGAHRRGLSPVYPLPRILQQARRMGIGVTLGDDSHGAHDVGVGLDACLSAIAAAGYNSVSYLARTDSTVAWQTAPLDEVKPRTR